MTADEVDFQPVQVPESSTCREIDVDDDESPAHKATVYIDPNAPNQSGRYNKHDSVHMSQVENGVRSKGVYTVTKGRLHKSGAFYEYQLIDQNGNLFKRGAWFREKDLRLEKRG